MKNCVLKIISFSIYAGRDKGWSGRVLTQMTRYDNIPFVKNMNKCFHEIKYLKNGLS